MPLTADGYPYETQDTLADENNPLMKPIASPSVLDELLGRNGTPRYQLWPERLARHAAGAIKDLVTMPHDEMMRGYKGEEGLLQAVQEKDPAKADKYIEPITEGLQVLLGSGRNLGALAGVPKDTLGTFVGQGSAIWNPVMADTAKTAIRMGVHPDDVWKKTGYGGIRDVFNPESSFGDRMMRTEVPDIGSRLRPYTRDAHSLTGIPREGEMTTLSNVLDHSELYKAEPRLAGLKVEGKELPKGVQAQYNGLTKTIEVSPMETAKLSADQNHALILHELSHAAEDLYGFGRGGSPMQFLPQDFGSRKEAIQDTMQALQRAAQPAMESVIAKHTGARDPQLATEGYRMLAELALGARTASSHEAALKAFKPKELEFMTEAMRDPRISQYFTHLHNEVIPMKQQELHAYELYKKLSGEEVARLAEKRMFMTPKQLRDMAPWYQHDTAATKQKVIYGPERSAQ